MLKLQNISLVQFRNYIDNQFHFSHNIVAICGANGVGKTNLLDAIYYLCFCKSYFNKTDNSSVTHSYAGFRIEGHFLLNNFNTTATCIIRETGKKEFLLNGDDYKKLSQHIGHLPCVFIAPNDIELINGTSDLRRKFIDVIISQLQHEYLQNLIDYNAILQQRNSLLKQRVATGNFDDDLFNILTQQLASKGTFIFEKRQQFLQQFLPQVLINYNNIALSNDNVQLQYQSQLQQNSMYDLLQKNIQTDFALQRTTVGVHKDDIECSLQNIKFKNIASQGQHKSLLFALKLAEWQMLQQHKGFSPILLLDDVFEKLDANRMNNLLHIVSQHSDAQIFITDTHKERLQQQLSTLNKNFQILEM